MKNLSAARNWFLVSACEDAIDCPITVEKGPRPLVPLWHIVALGGYSVCFCSRRFVLPVAFERCTFV